MPSSIAFSTVLVGVVAHLSNCVTIVTTQRGWIADGDGIKQFKTIDINKDLQQLRFGKNAVMLKHKDLLEMLEYFEQ